jgi:hypothetical protein
VREAGNHPRRLEWLGAPLAGAEQRRQSRGRSGGSRPTFGNFELQDLISRHNQAEALAPTVLKKPNRAAGLMIKKIGGQDAPCVGES